MRKRIQSLRHAINGLKEVLRREKNFQIQVLIAAAVFVAMLLLPLTGMERVVLVLVTFLVLLLEMTNSALEYTLDIFRPEQNSAVGRVKDVMAGAVLLASIGAALVGVLIFSPHVLAFFA
jgi:undecaprenol kinase